MLHDVTRIMQATSLLKEAQDITIDQVLLSQTGLVTVLRNPWVSDVFLPPIL